MKFSVAFVAVSALLAGTVQALPQSGSSDLRPVADIFSCGNTQNPDVQVEKANKAKIAEVKARIASARTQGGTAALATKQVPVYWHIIRKDTTVANGNVPSSAINAQISELNTRYGPSGFSFYLAGTDTTTSANWFDYAGPGTSQNTAMKKALRRGGVESLNVYSVGFTSISQKGLLGFAAFPQDAARNLVEDGIVFLHTTVPGGSIGANYNQGKVLSHEAGHWLGLYHTFQNSVAGQNGCVGDGDFVSDTNAEADATYGCPASRDSCPSNPGLDNLQNIMNYTYDTCKSQVTAGQTARMIALCEAYRNL